jgi:autotransporter-associated beta strand protein
VGNGNGAYSYSFGDTGASNGYLTVTITSNGVASNWIDTSGANPGSWTTLTNWSGGVPGTGSSGSGIGDSAIFGSPSATILNVSLNSAETVGSVVFAGTGSYAISGGNTLTLNNGSTSGPSIQDLGGNQAINVPINLAPSGAGLATTVTVSNSGDTLTLGAAVSGAGPLTKAGSGSLILSTADSYSGGTNINGGILQFSNINQLGSSSNITFGGGTLQYNGNTTDISAGTVTLAAGGGTIDTNGQNVTFANSIGNGGSGGFTKTGAGTLTLASTTNSYSGNTTVTGGTLNFAALAGLGTGTGITVNGGTLQWATSNLADISTRTVTIGANSGTFDANGNALVFTGAIGNNGSGNLTLTSSAANGSFTFDSASTYGGTTTINNLPVTINNNATLGAGAVTFLGINGSITSDYTANTLGLPGINVGSGAVGTITGSNRTSIAGLSGSGTVNLISTALPTLASGSPTGLLLASGTYSSFSGTINMSSSSSANNAVILDFNSGGFPGNMPSATVNLTNNVRLSSTNNSGGNTWTVGALEGDATSILAGSDYPGTTASSLTAVIGDSASTTFNGTLVNGNGGAGGLIITKQGTGVLTLTNGNSTYTGATNINGGYLRLMNGTTGSATGYSTAISVNNGGTLAGNGTISATANSALAVVTVASGGAIAPEYGSVAANGSVGTLTMDNLTLNTGSILNLEFNSAISGVTPDNGDLINVTGGTGLTINGGVVNPYNATTGALLTTPGTYNLIEYTGGTDSSGVLSPGAAALAAETPDHISYSFNNNGSFNGNSYVQLTITSNPPNYWTNGNHNSLWDTGDPGNWSTGVVPNGSIAIADFDSSAGGYTTPQNVSLSGGTVDVEQLIFHSAYAVSIGNGTINFDAGSLDSINVQALGSTVQAHTISAGIGVQNSALGLNVTVTNAADSLTFSGGFNGSGPLNVNAGGAGSGTIVLSADNTNFTGNTNVAGGALELAHTNALAGSSLSVTSPGAVTFAPSIGTFNVAAITSGNITLQDTSANPVTLAVGGQGASFTYTGALSGTGSLTKNGTGTMTIAPTGTATSITGTVNVNSGTLNVSAANAFTATNVTLAANATIDSTGSGDSFNNTNPMLMNGASTFTWGGSANFPVNNILLAPSATAANPAVLYSSGSTASEFGGTVTFDPGGQSVLVVENGSGINISLNSGTTNFSGTGTVVVPAANNTVGSTTYQYAGAIRFTNGGGLATNGGPGITFDVDGSIYTRTGTTGAGIVMGALTNDPGTPGSLGGQSATPIANTLYTIGALGESTTFGGTIVDGGDGTASIAVNGGTLTLTGASTYSGGTTVEAAGAELNLDYAGSLNPATTPTATTALSASAGTLLLNGTIAPTSILQATGGTIIVGDANNNPNSSPSGTPSARTIASLSVSSGKIQLANSTNGQINRSVLVVGTEGSVAGVTTFTGTGTLDLGSNDMIVTTSATDVNNTGELAALTAAAKSGLAGGWTGTGLVTSSGTFANNHNLNTGVAIVVNDTNQSGTALNGSPLIGTAQFNNGESQFDGQSVTDGDILVKYTYFGDALLDGNVTSADYLQIDNGFNNPLTGWYNGDFNYDGVVNGDDYSLIDNAYNSQGTAFPTSVSAGPAEMIASDTAQIDSVATPAVPEPTTLGMLGIGAAGMLMRRRRRNA